MNLKITNFFLLSMCLGFYGVAMDPPNEGNIIRLVFLGKTGSGKSTAINACYNFAMQKKWNNYPKLFPIPTEFQTCNIAEYAERAVENHAQQQLGAVTQTPSEYRVTGNGFTVSLIDCPGTGDPRGIDQDKNNSINIAKFLAKIEYINAFCIVLKNSLNRQTTEESYCIEEIKGIIPQKARDRIFIFATHSDLPNENTKNFAQSIGLPIENIFYFDNFALSKEGYFDVADVDMSADDTQEAIPDPFDGVQNYAADHKKARAKKVKNSWVEALREFDRLLRKAQELKNCDLWEMHDISSLKNSLRTNMLAVFEIAELLEQTELSLANALREYNDASLAATRAAEAYQIANNEYKRIKIELDANGPHRSVRYGISSDYEEKWALYKSETIRILQPSLAKYRENEIASQNSQSKYAIYSQSLQRVNSLKREKDGYLELIICEHKKLRLVSLYCINIHIDKYYDICIRKEQDHIMKERLNREKTIYLELFERYK